MDSRSSLLTPNGERLRWEAAEGDALIQRKNVLIGSTQQKMNLFNQATVGEARSLPPGR